VKTTNVVIIIYLGANVLYVSVLILHMCIWEEEMKKWFNLA